MMTPATPRRPRGAFSTPAALSLVVLLLGIGWNLFANRSYEGAWTVGEWLVNYAGGFVRRGLPGSLIYIFSKELSVAPVALVLAASLCSFAGLMVGISAFARQAFTSAFLLSPLVLLGPVLNGNFVRKDILVLALLGLCLLSIRASLRRVGGRMFPGMLLACLLFCVGILCHEAMFFIAWPVFLLVAIGSRLVEVRLPVAWWVTFLGLPLATFLACVQFRGEPSAALAIQQSWLGLGVSLPTVEPDGAIAAIGWSASEGLTRSFRDFGTFGLAGFVVAACGWVLTIYLAFLFYVGDPADSDRTSKVRVVLIQFLAVLPLFLLGKDYGRWIVLWISSAVLVYGFLVDSGLKVVLQSLPLWGQQRRVARFVPGIDMPAWAFLLIGIPTCDWTVSGYWAATPVGFLWSLLKVVLTKLA